MRVIRPADPTDRQRMAAAIDHLRTARDLLRQCGSPRAVAAARRALASASGAARHLDHRVARSE